MVATKDFRTLVGSGSNSSSKANMTSLSTLKLIPPPEKEFSGLPSPEFGMENRDEKEQGRPSGSERRSKHDGSSTPPPKIPNRQRQGKSKSTNRPSRGDNSTSMSRRRARSHSKTRHSLSNGSRERSQTIGSYSDVNERRESDDIGAFDYGSILGSLPRNEDDGSSSVGKSVSAMSKLLVSPSSAMTTEVDNRNIKKSTSPKKLVSSPKKFVTSHNTDARDKAKKPKVIIVGTAKVYSRSLIPPKVFHSSSTGLWISTINTSSDSSDDVKAFSFHTEQEARASAYANAPPVMIPFDNFPGCMLCDNKYSLLRRKKHCRNCGICICTNFSCSTNWSSKMIPETYNIKKTNTVKVCTSCDTLAKRFQHSLLEGRYETALELFLTGNINLRVPFAFKSEKEDMLPVHCAIKGRNEKLVRWLVETHSCPLQMVFTSKSTQTKENENYLPSLKTSKGRSILDLAMESQHCGILRFLVKEKHLSVFEVKDLNIVLGAVDTLIKEELPSRDNNKESKAVKGKAKNSKIDIKREISSGDNKAKESAFLQPSIPAVAEKVKAFSKKSTLANNKPFSHGFFDDSDEEDDVCLDFANFGDEESVCTTMPDICIVCDKKNVDCVAAPCGHQTCCMSCSNQLHSCPVCNTDCHFISIYQP